jgi:hypothetical protein
MHRLQEIGNTGAGEYFGAILNSPTIAYAYREMGSFYRSRGERPDTFKHWQREWADVVLGKDLGWHFDTHLGDALANGVRPDAIRAVYEGHEGDLTDEERQLATYVRAVIHGGVDADLYRGLERLLGRRGAVEYTAFCGHLIMTARLIQAFGTPGKSEVEYLAVLDHYVSGRREVPNPKRRVPGLKVPIFS